MKSTLLSAALIASLALVATVSTPANAADGTVNFTGLVVDQTCKITNTSQNVTLPWVFSSALLSSGATAGNTPFSIQITGCASALQQVSATFGGGSINSTTGNLTTTGTATQVELRLLNASDSSPIALNQTSAALQNSKPATLSGGGATLNYIAQYIAPQGNATAGTVASNVEFTMTYQ